MTRRAARAVGVLLLAGATFHSSAAHAATGPSQDGGVRAVSDTIYVLGDRPEGLYVRSSQILSNDVGYDETKHCLRRFDYPNDDQFDNTLHGGLVGGAHGCVRGEHRELLYYQPPAGFTGVDGIRYCITGLDGRDCLTSIVDIAFVVGPVPIGASSDEHSGLQGDVIVAGAPGVLGNDLNAFAARDLRPMLTAGPSDGTLDLRGDGSLTFDPGAAFIGITTAKYCVADRTSECVSPEASIRFQVDPAGRPHVYDVFYEVAAETPTPMCPQCGTNENVPIQAQWDIVRPPHNGTIAGAGPVAAPFVYTPNDGFVGYDSFTYCVEADPNSSQCTEGSTNPLQSNVASVSVKVVGTPQRPAPAPPAREPHPLDDAYETLADVALTVGAPGVLANDTQHDASLALEREPEHGTLDLRADGLFAYVPDAGFTGTDSFQYCLAEPEDPAPPKLRSATGRGSSTAQAADALKVSAPHSDLLPCTSRSAIVRIAVIAGEVPTDHSVAEAIDDTYATGHATPLEVEPSGVLLNDRLPGPTGAMATSQPKHGTLSQDPDGSLRYVPEDGFSGPDRYEYCLVEPGTQRCTVPPGNALDPGGPPAVDNTATVTITVGAPLVPDDPEPPPPAATDPPTRTLPITGRGTWVLGMVGCALLALGWDLRKLATLTRGGDR